VTVVNQNDRDVDRRDSSRVGVRRWWYGPLSLLLALAFCAVTLEVGARAFWRFGYQLSFRRPNHPLFAFYPGLKALDEARPRRGDVSYDVLMLGGSALHHSWGEVEPALAEQLGRAGLHNVRIFNLAAPAFTSRDSLLQYAALTDARFDLVIVYDGANDVRTNNVPPEIFRDDYSHYSWYASVNALASSHGTATFALPYTARYARALFRQHLAPNQFVPAHVPRPAWVEYGREPRSAKPFEHNMAAILDLAAERGDPVMLMTIASWVPADYSPEAFAAKTLDFGLHRTPIEALGRREYVVRAVALHSDIIRRLAAGRPNTLFVDQAALMDGSARNFDDPFHMTIAGSVTFVDHMMAVLRPHLPAR
jgi:lysophospholipase L1-like esterase